MVARLLREAEMLYARADAGIAALPFDCRAGIGAARRLYAAIGQQVARNGHDSVTSRAWVPLPRKLALAGRSLLAAPWPGPHGSTPPLDAVRDLVAAVVAAPAPPPRQRRPGLEARVVWLVTLFGELDGRQARES